MEKEIEELRRRVEQLERALMAVVTANVVGCDQEGRVMALSNDQTPMHYGGTRRISNAAFAW